MNFRGVVGMSDLFIGACAGIMPLMCWDHANDRKVDRIIFIFNSKRAVLVSINSFDLIAKQPQYRHESGEELPIAED